MSRIRPGLCSVTLRAESIDAVARIASECRLDGIEWGGDVHVPPGDLAAAARARAASGAADLAVASYGSYLFAGPVSDRNRTDAELDAAVETTLDTAVALGAPNVRVWAGFGVESGTRAYAALVDALAQCCAAAATRELTVALEFHGGTPTGTVGGTQALLDAIDAPNLFTYWQPPYWRDSVGTADAGELRELGRRLSHLHVYEWASATDRRSLAEGAARWTEVLAAAAAGALADDRVEHRYAFLEFVADDAVDALRRDAATLRAWLAAG